jgi:hypothetical protein
MKVLYNASSRKDIGIPLGQITLPMQFGNPNHFRTDYVNFMVADFEGT